jgi:hypothetical protein
LSGASVAREPKVKKGFGIAILCVRCSFFDWILHSRNGIGHTHARFSVPLTVATINSCPNTEGNRRYNQQTNQVCDLSFIGSHFGSRCDGRV